MTCNSSADIGMTRSRSLFDGATTSSAITSPLGRWYCRTLMWVSSTSSPTRREVRQAPRVTCRIFSLLLFGTLSLSP
jgi:hypothetical protein